MMKFQKQCSLLAVLLCSGIAVAQIASPSGSIPPTAVTPSNNNVLQPLGQLDQTARRTVMDLGNVRVDKWKTDGRTKDQNHDNVEALKRNLSSALPALMQQVQANPNSVAAAVKLYRNLNVVYDVLASVTESAGAFGSKDDYQALATDMGNLDGVRRDIADQLEHMATSQDAAYAHLVNEVRSQQQAAAAAPPKKVIVDDEAPAKKTTKPRKKKPAVSNPPSE